jgi:hypothetical protein
VITISSSRLFLGSTPIADGCADDVEKVDAIHQVFANLQQFNTLQVSVLGLVVRRLHRKAALTILKQLLGTRRRLKRVSENKSLLIRSKLSDPLGRVTGRATRPETNRLILLGAVGVWNCESRDRIKGL